MNRLAKTQCAVEGCEKGAPITRGWCLRHYHAWKTWGDPLKARHKGDHTTHALTGTPEWCAWTHMRSRCLNANHPAYKDYGARGIAICDRWDRFENFIADMGPRPSPKHTLERKENDKGYSPENCTWATMKEQSNNRRNSVVLTLNGISLTISQWADRLNIKNPAYLYERRSKGWPDEQVLTAPLGPTSRRKQKAAA